MEKELPADHEESCTQLYSELGLGSQEVRRVVCQEEMELERAPLMLVGCLWRIFLAMFCRV